MKNYSKNGFIQIPILIAIIIGVVAIGGGGYLGYNGYKNYQTQQAEKERISQEAEGLRQEEEKLEMERLKKEVEYLKNQPPKIIKETQSQNPESQEILTAELNLYATGVVLIICKDVQGSGSLWNLGNSYVVLTNEHVVAPYEDGKCVIHVPKIGETTIEPYSLNATNRRSWNKYTDVATLEIDTEKNDTFLIAEKSAVEIKSLNYKISSLLLCSTKMSLGSPVYVMGYPAFSSQEVNLRGLVFEKSFFTITNGIISSHDTSIMQPFGNLLYPNYFVSAKIDSGNSGGIAFSRDKNALCVLGIPTWISLGNYETQGIIQNIHNIFYSK